MTDKRTADVRAWLECAIARAAGEFALEFRGETGARLVAIWEPANAGWYVRFGTTEWTSWRASYGVRTVLLAEWLVEEGWQQVRDRAGVEGG